MIQTDKINLEVGTLISFLQDQFAEEEQEKGRNIFKNEDIIECTIRDDKVIAYVHGSSVYRVDFKISGARIVHVQCSCSSADECKHGAAVIYHLMSKMGNSLKEDSNSLNSRREDRLENFKANQYNFLPQISGISFGDRLDLLKPKMAYWFDNKYIQHRFISEEEIRSLIYEDQWPESNELIAEVEIKKEGKSVLYKCKMCQDGGQKLCEHQYVALMNLSKHRPGLDWLEDRMDYERELDMLSMKHGMTIDNLLSSFRVMIVNDSFLIMPKVEGNLVHMSTDDLRQQLAPAKGNGGDVKKHFFGDLERQSLFCNAIIWMPNGESVNESVFRIVEGKADKDKTRVGSHLRDVDYPTYFDDAQKEAFRHLAEAQQKPYSAPDVKIQTLHHAFESNWRSLMGIIHYFRVRDYGEDYSGDTKKNDIRQIFFRKVRADVKIRTFMQKDLIVLEAQLMLGDQLADFQSVKYSNGIFICDDKENGYLLAKPDSSKSLSFFKRMPRLLFFENERPKLFSILDILSKRYSVEIDLPFVQEVKVTEVRKSIYLRELGEYIIFDPVLQSGEVKFEGLSTTQIKRQDEEMQIYLLDPVIAQNFTTEINSLHPAWAEGTSEDFYHLSGSQLLKKFWFIDFFTKCEELGIEIFGQDELSKYRYSPHRATISTEVKSGIDWFDMDVEISFGNEKIETKDWIAAIRKNTPYVKLSDGSIGVLPEIWVNRLQQIQKAATLEKNKLRLSKLRFNVVEELFEDIDIDEQIMNEIAEKKRRLQSYSGEREYDLPANVQATLRGYQVAGYKWLKFLQEFGFGGCLADDMGLGKTLQAICLLADQKLSNGETSLVVVPRTLLHNWASEINKFCPTLTYLIYHGPTRRELIDGLGNYDVIISTYDTVSADIELLRQTFWNYVILDESQAIKNPTSVRYRAMCLLRAQHKLVMTGTPIENSTFDLYAQLNFANPGLLGNMSAFRRDFVVPIEKDQDVETSKLLQSMIHPFVLRRTKNQVAQDLPERTESILYCEMEEAQRTQYMTLRQQIKSKVNQKISADGVAKSKFMILEGLLRLRQMCNSPLLLDKTLIGDKRTSVKIETLVEHVTTEAGQHNALIFSQFVTMLDLIRDELDRLKIPYAYLDGSTKDRQAAINQFNDQDDHRIFLLSLKAGNTGLNLVKADYVYIVDPWWNPAVEAQAIDRTHRIGQDKHIFAYKLICKDTIEEKIVELQKKKKVLADDLIHTDAAIFKSLSKDELMSLFD